MMSPELCRQHIAYNAWATNRLLNAASHLTEDQLQRDFGTADKSVAETLLHLFRSERVWLHRLHGKSQPFSQPGDTWEAANAEWPALQGRWTEWASNASAEALAGTMHYSDLKGNPRSNLVWETVLHVVNHGTHHRGQVSGFLRALGGTPPSLDYAAFVRERDAALTSKLQEA
jgi:uncharacterized damage-inducible protein DinB